VLGDLVGFDFPTWTLGVQFRYPLGNSTQKVIVGAPAPGLHASPS
jgi:hypothetical protein